MKNRRNISDAAESAGERDLQEKIDAFCLMDDKFMRKCLEKARASVQYIVRAESGETIQNDKRREKGNERSSRKNVR